MPPGRRPSWRNRVRVAARRASRVGPGVGLHHGVTRYLLSFGWVSGTEFANGWSGGLKAGSVQLRTAEPVGARTPPFDSLLVRNLWLSSQLLLSCRVDYRDRVPSAEFVGQYEFARDRLRPSRDRRQRSVDEETREMATAQTELQHVRSVAADRPELETGRLNERRPHHGARQPIPCRFSATQPKASQRCS
jgi:hypothetical protein